jgi:hypothetical protein
MGHLEEILSHSMECLRSEDGTSNGTVQINCTHRNIFQVWRPSLDDRHTLINQNHIYFSTRQVSMSAPWLNQWKTEFWAKRVPELF